LIQLRRSSKLQWLVRFWLRPMRGWNKHRREAGDHHYF